MICAKSFFGGIIFSIVFISLFFGFFNQASIDPSCSQVDPIFSPESEREIISLIDSADESIELEMYVFTNERIATSLIRAVSRGVRVRIILEARTNSYNLNEISDALVDGGVDLRWASFDFKLTHSKMMILDGERVFFGSTNFSKSAVSKNREVAAVISGKEVLEFVEMFESDWKKATMLREK